MNVKDICRLCASRGDFSKDLADEDNKYVLKIIQEFIKIEIRDNDELPTKICLNCEEKIVSFQLFILECYKVQDALKKIHLENNENVVIKFEDDVAFLVSEIKAEVKDEITPEDIVSAINNETLPGTDDTIYDINTDDNHSSDDDHNSDGDFDDDNVTIASLKHRKEKDSKRIIGEEDVAKLNEVLMRSNLRLSDFFKFTCHVCEEKWSSFRHLKTHTIKAHNCAPKVFCVCGESMRSKRVLHDHVRNHKMESRDMKQKINFEKETTRTKKYSKLKLKEFIKFICQTCNKECSSWYKLKIHCEKVHKINAVVRCKCGVSLKSKSVVYKHVQDHNNPDALCCDKCPRITKTEAAMRKHKMRHVPKSERKFVCDICDKVFHKKDCLKSHHKSHIPIEERKIYQCDICNLKFTARSSAASHKRVVHEKVKSYVCDLCGYACGTNGELRQHRAIHSDDKPFVCTKCSKPFKTYSNLKTHMDTHEGTSYACYVCNRVLNSRRTLRKHLLVHEDKACHVCSFCNKAFKRRQTLKVHMYTHTGDKPLSCKWCEEKFAYASTLRSHRLRCHADKVAAHNYIYNSTHVITAVRQGFNINQVDNVTAKNEMEAPQ